MHRARKRFGQHFLHDQTIIDRILRALDPAPGQDIVEIGPGQGALTWPLLKACQRMTAIELDRDLVPILEEKSQKFGELDVINADILEFDLARINADNPLRVVGNLPYNISTPLMFHLLESVAVIADMHFMVQKEVAQRIVASPGDTNYGRLSIMLQYRCECQYLFEVAPESFTPPPKVDSAVIRLLPRKEPLVDVGDPLFFAALVQNAFSQRRKTISNSLKGLVSRETIEACGIDPRLRAENLDLQDFALLGRSAND